MVFLEHEQEQRAVEQMRLEDVTQVSFYFFCQRVWRGIECMLNRSSVTSSSLPSFFFGVRVPERLMRVVW